MFSSFEYLLSFQRYSSFCSKIDDVTHRLTMKINNKTRISLEILEWSHSNLVPVMYVRSDTKWQFCCCHGISLGLSPFPLWTNYLHFRPDKGRQTVLLETHQLIGSKRWLIKTKCENVNWAWNRLERSLRIYSSKPGLNRVLRQALKVDKLSALRFITVTEAYDCNSS